MECIIMTPLGDTVLDLSVEDKCGREFKYRTNIQDTEFTIGCLNCNEQVTLHLGAKGTAFVTPHEERGGTP